MNLIARRALMKIFVRQKKNKRYGEGEHSQSYSIIIYSLWGNGRTCFGIAYAIYVKMSDDVTEIARRAFMIIADQWRNDLIARRALMKIFVLPENEYRNL